MLDLRTKRTAAGGGAILLASFAATAALNYGFGIALAWILPASEFGVFSVMQNLLVLAGSLLAAGFPWVLAKVVAQTEDVDFASDGRATTAFRAAMVGNLAIGLALAGAYLVAQATTGRATPGVSWTAALLIAATIAVLAFNCISAAALHGARRFDALGLMRTSEVVVKVVVGIAAGAAIGLGASGIALGFLVGGIVAAGCSWWALRDRYPGRGPLRGAQTLSSALPTGIGTSGFGLLLTLDVLLLGAIGIGNGVSLVVIATYQVASILARAPYFLGEALADAVFPFIAAERMRSGAHAWFVAGFRWVPLALVPLQLVLLVAPGPVLGTFFPAIYGDAENLVRLITIGTVGLIVADLLLKALYARGLAAPAARYVTVAVAAEVLALVVLVPVMGAEGAAVAAIGGHWTCAGLLGLVYLRHVRPTRPLRLPARTVGGYAGAVAVLVLFLVAAQMVAQPVGLLLIAAGLVSYVLVALRTGVLTGTDLGRVRRAAGGLAARLAPPARRLGGHLGRQGGVWLLIGACTLLVATTLLWNLNQSPDTQYDEVVYTRAAQEVAQGWQLTWTNTPMFVHPPISFLLQGGWLRLLGLESAPLDLAITATRLLTALITIANVLLLARLIGRMVPGAGPARRRLLMVVVVVLAAFDPVLLRYGRLAIIEPFALLGCLVTLSLALALQNRPARLFVPLVGLATGLTLLTKEVSVFLLLTPLLHGLFTRNPRLVGKALGALTAGLAFWLLFPLWAAQLGLLPKFLDVKFVTFERLLGVLQYSGWNRPGVSFVSAIGDHADQYASSYLLLAGGALALVWLLLNRLDRSAYWLLAFLVASYGFGAYIVLLGTLNEQFFVYVVPAALVGSVLAVDALPARRRATLQARTEPADGGRTSGSLVAVSGALVVTLGLGVASWAQSYVPNNDGLVGLAANLRATAPTCSAVNVTGDAEKYVYLLPGYTITQYATAEGALNHGVHLFVLSDKDVASGYGDATTELTDTVRSTGTRLAAFPSETYGGLELWQVQPDSRRPLVDVETLDAGAFVTTQGSRCGGYTVFDVGAADFLATWTDVGGKGSAGPPLSGAWTVGDRTYQAFDGIVLTSSPTTDTASVPVVRQLAELTPAAYRQAQLPPVTVAPGGAEASDADVLARLTDPTFRSVYLGALRAPADASEALSRSRTLYGDPLGPAVQMPDGQVRQAFGGAVLEYRPGTPDVRLAPVGTMAMRAGVVAPSAGALSPVPPPPSPPVTDELAIPEPTTVEPFVRSLLIALGLYLAVAVAVNLPMLRRRAARQPGPTAHTPRPAGGSHDA